MDGIYDYSAKYSLPPYTAFPKYSIIAYVEVLYLWRFLTWAEKLKSLMYN